MDLRALFDLFAWPLRGKASNPIIMTWYVYFLWVFSKQILGKVHKRKTVGDPNLVNYGFGAFKVCYDIRHLKNSMEKNVRRALCSSSHMFTWLGTRGNLPQDVSKGTIFQFHANQTPKLRRLAFKINFTLVRNATYIGL